MPALIGLILILGISMMLFGAIDKKDLPPELAGLAAGGSSVAASQGLPGAEAFGTVQSPAWQDGWKLFQDNGVLYVATSLGGRYKEYDPPQLYLGCIPRGRLSAMLDTRLALQADKLKIKEAVLDLDPPSKTWYRLSDKVLKAALDNGSVSLRFDRDWAAFSLPENTRTMAGTLLAACEHAGAAAGKQRTAR